MTGWKSKLGCLIIAIGSLFLALAFKNPEMVQVAEGLIAFGAGLLGLGIAHKIEKGQGDD